MSIGILVSVHDGLVLAADSASTLSLLQPTNIPDSQNPTVLNVYNNANKIANLYKGEPIGCVAFGAGSIGNASISTLLKDFRFRITSGAEPEFDVKNYTIKGVADLLTEFLMQQVKHTEQQQAARPNAVNLPKINLGVLLGGYSMEGNEKRKGLGEGWMIQIENSVAKSPKLLRQEHEVGINWGGEGDAVARLLVGFSDLLPQILESVVQPQPAAGQLLELLRASLQAPLVFAPMPIQDAIDLAEWLVHTAIMFSRFKPGVPSVGGPIEIAAITKHEGFRWIKRKYYFKPELNPETA